MNGTIGSNKNMKEREKINNFNIINVFHYKILHYQNALNTSEPTFCGLFI